MKRDRGFTLIELLVVIAIIGILSAVVLASLSTAQSKGNDAAIQSDLTGIRTQAQLYFVNNNNYGTNPGPGVESNCSATDNVFSDPTIIKQVQGADAANGVLGTVTCNVAAGGTAYAVSAQLVATPGTYYCVDSADAGGVTTTPLGSNTSC